MPGGPDRVVETEELRTWEADGHVKLRMTDEPFGDLKPKSLVTLVREQAVKFANHTAMAVKRDGEWQKWSYKQYHEDIKTAAKAFIKLGLEPHHTVAIYGFNSPEWFIGDIAAIFAGGFACGLYPTNSAEVCEFIMNDSKTNILMVEDEKALDKLWKVRNDLKHLKKIIQWGGELSDRPDVISWKEFMAIGRDESDYEMDNRIEDLAVNGCSTLIYTSGTTGNPKGVMISHDNVWFTLKVALEMHDWNLDGSEVVISYLPLSHIAAQMVDIWAPMGCGGAVYFADKMALKGSLPDYLREVRPTQFFGVPRVWEKIMEAMKDKGRDVKGFKKKIADNCKKAGLAHHLDGKNGIMYTIGQKAVYSKVKQALGLDRCKRFYTGAAPISMEVLKYFLSLDMVILELYGMSEMTGPHTFNTMDHLRIGSVGQRLHAVKVRLANKNENGEGELCGWGRNVMMGYLRREDKTVEDLDEEGWIHSGDMACKDEDDFYYITGRIKELLITSGGENIAPVPIEENIKTALPCISNAILIGDKRKFLTAFLTFKVVVDQSTDMPTRKLAPSAVEWCKTVANSNATTVDEILSAPDVNVMRQIQKGIDAANRQSVSNAARVQKWTVLPTDVSIGGGELGPTLKLKRFAFNKKYANAIERLYV